MVYFHEPMQSTDQVDVRRSVLRVPRTAQRCMARQFSAPGASAPRHFTYHVRVKAQNME